MTKNMTQFANVKKPADPAVLDDIQMVEALYTRLDQCEGEFDSPFTESRPLSAADVTLMSDVETLLVNKASYDLALPILKEMVAFVSQCTLIKQGRKPRC
jgi:hypothetical protein